MLKGHSWLSQNMAVTTAPGRRAGVDPRSQTGTQDKRHQLRPDGLGGGGGQELVCWPELPDRLGALTRGGDAGPAHIDGRGALTSVLGLS